MHCVVGLAAVYAIMDHIINYSKGHISVPHHHSTELYPGQTIFHITFIISEKHHMRHMFGDIQIH